MVLRADRRARGARPPIRILDLGGGWPVPYRDGEVPPIEAYAERAGAAARADALAGGLQVCLEPGRSLLANSGDPGRARRALKRGRAKTFVICDAGMHVADPARALPRVPFRLAGGVERPGAALAARIPALPGLESVRRGRSDLRDRRLPGARSRCCRRSSAAIWWRCSRPAPTACRWPRTTTTTAARPRCWSTATACSDQRAADAGAADGDRARRARARALDGAGSRRSEAAAVGRGARWWRCCSPRACTSSPTRSRRRCDAAMPAEPMREILESHPGLVRRSSRAPRTLRLQAVLGTDRGAGRTAARGWCQHGFRLGAEYFYPASTVKLFAAVAALERLGEMRARHRPRRSPPTRRSSTIPSSTAKQLEDGDPTNLDGGAITVRHEIRKLFLVSDNEAFNRLYELVGQDGLAASLRARRAAARRASSIACRKRAAPRRTGATRGSISVGAGFVHTLPERSSEPLAASPRRADARARGRAAPTSRTTSASRDRWTSRPRTASRSPSSSAACARWCARTSTAAAAAVRARRRRPRATARGDEPASRASRRTRSTIPPSTPTTYVKFLLPGCDARLGGRGFAIYDKSGQAYGFTTENAYVVDGHAARRRPRRSSSPPRSTPTPTACSTTTPTTTTTVALPFFADLAEATVRWLRP